MLAAATIVAMLAAPSDPFPRGVREVFHDLTCVGSVLVLNWLTLRLVDLALDARAQPRRSAPGTLAGLGARRRNRSTIRPVGPRPEAASRARPREEQPVATVELIGMRSPRASTSDRVLVASQDDRLPACVIERPPPQEDMRFEIRLHLGLATASQPPYDICARIEALLGGHPSTAGDPPSVHLAGRGDAWFDLEAMAWFDAPDGAAFHLLCDQLLRACFDIVGEAGDPATRPGDGPSSMLGSSSASGAGSSARWRASFPLHA